MNSATEAILNDLIRLYKPDLGKIKPAQSGTQTPQASNSQISQSEQKTQIKHEQKNNQDDQARNIMKELDKFYSSKLTPYKGMVLNVGQHRYVLTNIHRHIVRTVEHEVFCKCNKCH